MRIIHSSIGLALSVATFVAGCGEGSLPRKPVHPVTGKVTMHGAPLMDATVTFGPMDGQPLAYGKTNDAGEYKLTTYTSNDGAAVGNFSVIVSKSIAAEGAKGAGVAHGNTAGVNYNSVSHAGGKAAKKSSGSVISPEYTDTTKTPLKFKVEPKANRYDFEVK